MGRRKYRSIDSPAQARGAVIGGAVLLVIGLAITIGTYVWADHRGGGTYIVSWGPMLAGLITLIRGLVSGSRVGFRGGRGSGGGGVTVTGGGRRPRRGQPSWHTPASAAASPAWGWQGQADRAGQAGQTATGFPAVNAPAVPAAGAGGSVATAAPAPQAQGAGWLSDPWDPTRLRWWDGQTWGAQTAAR